MSHERERIEEKLRELRAERDLVEQKIKEAEEARDSGFYMLVVGLGIGGALIGLICA